MSAQSELVVVAVRVDLLPIVAAYDAVIASLIDARDRLEAEIERLEGPVGSPKGDKK